MVSDEDSDSTSECGSVGSAPQVSMDDSDGWEEEWRWSGHETMPCQCHAPAFDLQTNDVTWSTSFCPPSNERTSEITVECSL